jgi:putative SOS response-associated peptidase YedK
MLLRPTMRYRRVDPRSPTSEASDVRMCMRFYLVATAAELKRRFRLDQRPDPVRRYNIAPTQTAPVVVTAGRTMHARLARWGLVPPWSRDLSLASRMINAPAEAIEETPAFRAPFHSQRCLVPASGYYEWRTGEAKRQPYRIALRNGALCALAGLWERWTPETGEPVDTFTIVTTRANKLLNEVHDRMPVIIAPADYQRWLTGAEPTAKKLLVPYTGAMTITPVSDRVNDVKQDDAGLIARLSG